MGSLKSDIARTAPLLVALAGISRLRGPCAVLSTAVHAPVGAGLILDKQVIGFWAPCAVLSTAVHGPVGAAALSMREASLSWLLPGAHRLWTA